MKFDLLLLFALVGSFCIIAHASTLVVPTDADLAQVTGATVGTKASTTVNEEEDAPNGAVTEASTTTTTAATGEETEATSAHAEVPVETTETPSVPTVAHEERTEAPVQSTVAPSEETETSVGVTEAPVEEGKGSTPATTEGVPEVNEASDKDDLAVTEMADTAKGTELMSVSEVVPVSETETGEMEVEDSDGMSTGHVVGIVFGALVAVVIIIAVIVVVVRRMGQYSP